MNKKTTKKALLTSLLSLILCFAMLIGSTFAWFTDSVTSGNNRIQSGNLDIKLEYSSTFEENSWTEVTEKTEIFKEDTLWEPGHAQVVYLKISNLGSLALKYMLGINIISETPGVNQAGDTFMLSDYIQFGQVVDVTEKYAQRADAVSAVESSSKKLSEGYTLSGNMKANDPAKYLALVVYMPENVSNDANHNGTNIPEIRLGISLAATQLNSENDSFGPDYDALATYRYFAKTYPFNDVSELADFDPALFNPSNTAGSGLALENGKAVVNAKGAFIFFDADVMKYRYVIEYDVDASKLANGESIAFESGDTASWEKTNYITVKNDDGLKVSVGSAANNPTEYVNNQSIGGTFHVKTTHEYDNGNWVTTTTITDGTNTYTGAKTRAYDGTKSNIYWDVYDLSANAGGQVAFDNFTHYAEDYGTPRPAYVLPELENQVEVTSENFAATDFTKDSTHYVFKGAFDSLDIRVAEGKTQIFDGSAATVTGQVKIGYENGKSPAHSYENTTGEKTGTYIAYGFTADSVSVATFKTSIVIAENKAGSIDVDSANVDIVIYGNEIDGANVSHATYQGTTEYGVYLYVVDYNLKFDYNAIKNTVSHVVGINGRESDFAKGSTATNNIASFSNNELTISSKTDDKRAAVKIWDDTFYAPNAGNGSVNTKAQEFIDLVLASKNTIEKAEGMNHFNFSIYDLRVDK